ncbi:MAG: N-acetylmuramoyl-L-alanine amidase [Sphingomonas sp.]|jgi:N-acetylmuramoyl-L-alanine amidase
MTITRIGDRDIVSALSPNYDSRSLPVTMIVLHYTGMENAAVAVERLCDPMAKVSAHYVVEEDGLVHRLVLEEHRAWHAGKSHWREVDDVNSASIGIEIVNPGHEFGYRPFPDEQIAAVIELVASIKERYGITRGNIVGHSDIAPLRKRDPGELFPWARLSRLRLALPRPTKGLVDPGWTQSGFLLALERFGYDVAEPMAAVMAFQRRFRPELIDGEIDAECRMILLALLLPKPQGDE